MRPPARLFPALLRTHPQFRRFWTGQTVSLIGDQVTAAGNLIRWRRWP